MASEKLSVLAVAKSRPGLLGDGRGLWLSTTGLKSGGLSRRWLFRYRRVGKYFEVPLGQFPDISLSDARLTASKLRAQLASGGDPVADRRARIEAAKVEARAATLATLPPYTFKAALAEYLQHKAKHKWRSAPAARQWSNNLKNYALPQIGSKAVIDITHDDALTILDPLYARSAIVGARVRMACEAIVGFANARHKLSLPNHFAWKGNLENVYSANHNGGHFQTIPYRKLPELYAQLIAMSDDPGALAGPAPDRTSSASR